MKKLIASALVLSTVLFTYQSMTAKSAHALLVFDALVGADLPASGEVYVTPLGVLLAIILLPVVVLDEKSPSAGTPSVTTQDLLNNGYTADQVANIQKDQATMVTQLQAQGLKMVVEPNSTFSQIQTALQQKFPGVSNDYVQFVADYAGAR
jgi:hypothetical protein